MSDFIFNYYKNNNIKDFTINKITENDVITQIKKDFENLENIIKQLYNNYPVEKFNLIKYIHINNNEQIKTNIKIWRYQFKLPDYIILNDSFKHIISNIASKFNATAFFKIAHIKSKLWNNLRGSSYINKNIVLIEIISNIDKDYIDEWIKKNDKQIKRIYLNVNSNANHNNNNINNNDN